MTMVYRELVAVLDGPARLVDVREVEARVHPLAEEIERERDDVDVARALAVAEERALDALAAGHECELCRRHGGAAVVVRMDRKDDRITARDVATEPLELVGV